MTINTNVSESSVKLLSPLRYPGSKRSLIQYIKDVIRLNRLSPKLFFEPFVGGASMSLQLLADNSVERVALADKDPLIASFWQSVFFDTEWLIKAIEKVEISLENWKRFKKYKPRTVRNQALKCIFLNRTSYSGIMAPSGGPLGGYSQESEYGIDCRFTKKTVIERIRFISHFRDRVAFVQQGTWFEVLEKVNEIRGELEDRDLFLYADPPFYYKAERLYSHYFLEADHQFLHDSLVKIQYPWLLSYDPAEPIVSLYSSNGTQPKRIETLYSVANNTGFKTAQELIITNLPNLPD